jgi:hypothetical protein
LGKTHGILVVAKATAFVQIGPLAALKRRAIDWWDEFRVNLQQERRRLVRNRKIS